MVVEEFGNARLMRQVPKIALGSLLAVPGDRLAESASVHEVVETTTTPHGIRIVVDGTIPVPAERSGLVRTVWIPAEGTEIPRLVTAYPLRPGRRL